MPKCQTKITFTSRPLRTLVRRWAPKTLSLVGTLAGWHVGQLAKMPKCQTKLLFHILAGPHVGAEMAVKRLSLVGVLAGWHVGVPKCQNAKQKKYFTSRVLHTLMKRCSPWLVFCLLANKCCQNANIRTNKDDLKVPNVSHPYTLAHFKAQGARKAMHNASSVQ
jgi:hypothetical protein